MILGSKGLALLESSEGLRLIAYRDVAGILTIGYGHTGPDVHEGQTITQAEAEILLQSDVGVAEYAVNHYVLVPLTQNQFDALVVFTFNIGTSAFHSSTLLRKLNSKDYLAAAAQFPLWNKAGGRSQPGLVKRRASEQALFEL